MKSVMSHSFSNVPQVHIPRSQFDRSHTVKTTFDGGYLVPFFADEGLPGDTLNLRTAGMCRLATPYFPVMDNMYMDTFYFAVPIRLVWENWVKMMGEQDAPGDSTDYITPKIDFSATAAAAGSIYDYLGVPTQVTPGPSIVAFWCRAYNLIWNTWFRDENLQDPVDVPVDDGPDAYTLYDLLKRGKRHDYFTSALPWLQKNNAGAVDIPLGTSAPLANLTSANTDVGDWSASVGVTMTNPGSQSPGDEIGVDLSSATAATINQLRQAFQVQSMYEIDARSGTRYIEIIRAHFGVVSPDARLQRPEYLGGGSTPINFTPVTSTTANANADVGTLGAYSTATFNGHGFNKSLTEHCVILGLVNVRADLTYQQGINKMFLRQDRLDYYWPALSVIGEQAIENQEIYYQGTSADTDVFGYQERFAEYRYKPSTIHGDFRSNATASLDAWHLSQDFSSLPTLGDTFIQDSPPIDRVVIDINAPEFIGDFYHRYICARPMPVYGIPGSLMRF